MRFAQFLSFINGILWTSFTLLIRFCLASVQMFGVLITVLNLIDVISLHDPVREVKRTQKELRKLQRFINLTCYSTLSPLQDTIYISFLIFVNGPSNWYKVS